MNSKNSYHFYYIFIQQIRNDLKLSFIIFYNFSILLCFYIIYNFQCKSNFYLSFLDNSNNLFYYNENEKNILLFVVLDLMQILNIIYCYQNVNFINNDTLNIYKSEFKKDRYKIKKMFLSFLFYSISLNLMILVPNLLYLLLFLKMNYNIIFILLIQAMFNGVSNLFYNILSIKNINNEFNYWIKIYKFTVCFFPWILESLNNLKNSTSFIFILFFFIYRILFFFSGSFQFFYYFLKTNVQESFNINYDFKTNIYYLFFNIYSNWILMSFIIIFSTVGTIIISFVLFKSYIQDDN